MTRHHHCMLSADALLSLIQDGDTALMFAAMRGEHAVAEALLEAGAALDIANQARAPVLQAGAEGNSHLTLQLLDASALCAQAGCTALMCAAMYGHTRLVDLLLSRGADASAKDAVRTHAALALRCAVVACAERASPHLH